MSIVASRTARMAMPFSRKAVTSAMTPRDWLGTTYSS